MYTAEELRQDILANLKGNADFPAQIPLILESAVFQFNDTNYFTRVIWNTYEHNLIIFCATEDRSELEKYKEELFSLCTKVHGTQDCYLLMTLEIIAKSTISPATKNSSLTDETISISNTITINRSTDYVGHGGFASVYKYYDEEKEKLIAIKIYDPSAFQDSSPEIMKKRFLREGKKLLGYSHPNVVKVFDYGFLRDDSAYIKMEYISGTRLYDYVITNGPLNSTLVNSLCYQYIDAMAYVHSQTDIHRDISYSNVMINTSNEIKVLDFGFARNSDDTNYDTEYKDIQRKFVLPNETYTFRTEIYCIGAILYTLITGNIFTDYDSTLLNNATCDTKLIEATKICLQNNPQNRFEDAIALKNMLKMMSLVSMYIIFHLIPLKNFLKITLNYTLPFNNYQLKKTQNIG